MNPFSRLSWKHVMVKCEKKKASIEILVTMENLPMAGKTWTFNADEPPMPMD
jgi:hypothetical protein